MATRYREDRPHQLSDKQVRAEVARVRVMREEGEALAQEAAPIEYATATFFTLEAYARRGDEKAAAEMKRRRGF